MGFNLICWTPICGKYLMDCSILEKCRQIWKNGWAAMAGLGKYRTGGYGQIWVFRVFQDG